MEIPAERDLVEARDTLIESEASTRPWTGADILQSPWTMLLAGIFLGFLCIAVYHSNRIPWGSKFSAEDIFDSSGWESVSIATSLAQGKGFASPFGVASGPTAWLAPVYPYLLAALFHTFGLYSEASAIVMEGINVVFLALTGVALFRIAKIIFDEQVALWTAWIWTVLPCLLYVTENSYFTSPYFSSVFIAWESALSILVLSALFLFSLEISSSTMRGKWIVFGLAWGFAAQTNPALLSFLPVALGRACIHRRREGKSFWRPAGITLLVLGLAVTPWMIRNYREFGRVVLLRSNLGAELHYGNLNVSEGVWIVHPALDASELSKYVRLGESRYIQYCWAELLGFVRHHPEKFATLTVRRVVFYWTGEPAFSDGLGKFSDFTNTPYTLSSVLGIWGLVVAWRQQRNGAGLLVALFLAFPAIYYISHAMTRYRAPLEPEMIMLSVFLIRETLRGEKPPPSAFNS